jgi:hypothetical protein
MIIRNRNPVAAWLRHGGNAPLVLWLLALTNSLTLLHLIWTRSTQDTTVAILPPQLLETAMTVPTSRDTRNRQRQQGSFWDIPQGKAVALPSIRVDNDNLDRSVNKKQQTDAKYGGAGDKSHLGGFVDLDMEGISPALWKGLIGYFGIKSILDVGCGKGISTSWFHLHGVDAQCVEGSHDAILQNIHPLKDTKVIEHDFSRGPWWPEHTVDAVWCVEFLEHVGRNFHHNYLPAFRKAAFIIATHSTWGGWHHVEVHNSQWWKAKVSSKLREVHNIDCEMAESECLLTFVMIVVSSSPMDLFTPKI